MGAREEEALRVLAQPITDGVVDDSPPPAMVVHSLRMPVELFGELLAEADRRGVKPGALAREFIEQGLRPAGGEFVQLDRLRAELDQAVQRARVAPPAAA